MGIIRQVFLSLCISSLILISAAEATTVKGKIANASKQKKAYLYVFQGDRLIATDSNSLKNGSFSFKSKADGFPQGMYKIGYSPENSSTLILGKQDMEVELDSKAWEKPVINNSPENSVYNQFKEINNSLNYQMRILDQKYQNLSPMAQTNPQAFQQAVMGLRQKVDSLMRDQQQKLSALKQANPGLFMAKVVDFSLNDANQTAENFITPAQLEDPELQKTNLWESRFLNYVQRFGENDPEKWVILADQIVNQMNGKTVAREIALRSAAKALLVLEQSGINAGYDLAKKYNKEFPGRESEQFLTQFTPGPPGVGEMAPDIQLADRDGKILPLSNLKGKVVLLDFWASWCGPCRHENPNVVRAYNQYKDKGFTVFSVSLDQSKDKWLAAIAKDGLAWENHVSDLKGWGSAGAALYQVRGIPATFLLDKNGKIIAKNLRGSALEDKLKELLGP
jgi:thiol-disulfide isomerase/thioredoxin